MRRLLWLFAAPALSFSADYYVDAAQGSDLNSGTSRDRAWQSLPKVNATAFAPGDRLFFASGSSWTGTLHPHGSGSESKPITIDRYGEGAPPVINGDGAEAALLLENQQHWEVYNLAFTNRAPDEGLRRGVLVRARDAGVLRHIHLVNLHVHDVKGKLGADTVSKTTGGIAVEVRGNARASRFDDVLIANCRVERVDNTGIYTWADGSPHPRDPRWSELRFTNLVIRGNTIVETGKNALGVRASLAPLIQHNTIRKSSARLHGNAIYVFGCKDARIEYNDVSGTRFDRIEGAAFDSDYNSEGTIIQFNYSHGNGGGLVNLCNNPSSPAPRGYNDGTIVRNNISRDEIYRVIGFDGTVTNTVIEDNTIYVGASVTPNIIEFDKFGKAPGYADGVVFRRNVFVVEGKGEYVWGEAKNVVFENNSFLGEQPRNAPPSGAFSYRPAVPYKQDLKADLYLPAGAGPFPAVVFIHGGGWRSGDRAQLRNVAAHLASRGIAGMAISYRLSGQAKYPAALDDSKAAVRWLRENASKYRVDGKRIAVAGSSAGGHLSALLGLTASKEEAVTAVVALNPVLDLTTMAPSESIDMFVGGPCATNMDLCREGSPIHRIHSGAPPIFILHGKSDKTVPFVQAAAMAAKLEAARLPVRLFAAVDAPHTFWSMPRWRVQVLDEVTAFLERAFKP